MFGSHFTEDLTRDGRDGGAMEAQKRPKSPPKTCEEWFSHAGISQWPSHTPAEALVGAPETQRTGEEGERREKDVVMGSLEEIKADLRAHSSWDSAFLENIDQRLQTLEKQLGVFADRFICEPSPTARESTAGGLAITTGRTFLTELCSMELLTSTSHKTNQQGQMKLQLAEEEDNGKSVEALVFPGFAERRTVPLPGKLESLPILDIVTKTLTWPPYLVKAWRRLFYSDASCSIFQNSFWWIWMDYFKPDVEVQARLFDMIADSFVTLLHSMEGSHKDEVFMYGKAALLYCKRREAGRGPGNEAMHYPGCLAQALYSAFCHAFPKSNKTFNSAPFLSFLTNLTSEWITGVKSPPMSWEGWPRYLLDPYHAVKTEADGNTTTTAVQRPQTHKQSSHVHFRQARSATKSASLARQLSTVPPGKRREDKSVGVGPGPSYECVQFSVLGHSPLLQHFLLSHHLSEEVAEESFSRFIVSRTQVKELPGPSVSYGELLEQHATAAKERYDSYERQVALCNQEVNAMHKKHTVEMRGMERHNKRLLQHRHEVASLAEKLMSKRANGSLPPVRNSKSTHRT